MRAYLFVRSGANSGEMYPLEKAGTMVGRGLDCDLRISDPYASRQHFRVERRGREFHVVDSGGKSATAVNGVPVSEKLLHWGDEIRAGNTRLVFMTGQAPGAGDDTDSLVQRVTRTFAGRGGRHEMIGISPAMNQVFVTIEKVAPLDVTVLLGGESGTGKELVARALHAGSPRSAGPLVAVNCAAIPEGLIESELFGHERGAFTGANARRRGRFELAAGGTLLLDEIGDLPLESQSKLLRVLEERRLVRVGGTEEVEVDVRLVAASSLDLHGLAEAGRFRSELLFRLEVVRIDLPPLRKRAEDIPELARFFLERYRHKVGRRVEGLSPEALRKLTRYAWPGNVREMKNVIERALIMGSGSRIEAEDLVISEVPGDGDVVPTLAEIEKRYIERAMKLSGGNKKRAAEMLGIPRSSLYDKLKEHSLV